jgi:hypothetical protein
MGQYGRAALTAAHDLAKNQNKSPRDAWQRAIELETHSHESRKKGCPRDTFLACWEMVTKSPPGTYTASRDNRVYAEQAIKILHKDKTLTPAALWLRIGQPCSYNSQMDVVVALYQENLFH